MPMGNNPPQVIPETPMKIWEYHTVSDANWYELEILLNELGQHGWEAVGFAFDTSGTSVLLKRQKGVTKS